MKNFIRAKFIGCPPPTVFCSQQAASKNLFDCLLLFPSGIPNKSFTANFSYNYQSKSGGCSVPIDPLKAQIEKNNARSNSRSNQNSRVDWVNGYLYSYFSLKLILLFLRKINKIKTSSSLHHFLALRNLALYSIINRIIFKSLLFWFFQTDSDIFFINRLFFFIWIIPWSRLLLFYFRLFLNIINLGDYFFHQFDIIWLFISI